MRLVHKLMPPSQEGSEIRSYDVVIFIKIALFDCNKFDFQFWDKSALSALLVILAPLLLCKINISELSPCLTAAVIILVLSFSPALHLNMTVNTEARSGQISYLPPVTWREVNRLNTSTVKHHQSLEPVVIAYIVAGYCVRQDVDGVLSATHL